MSRLRNSLTDTNTSGGGVSDHGALTGLADDDHTQYLNTARHTAITGNPHGTAAGDISDFNETVRDVIGTALVAGSNVTITVNDAGNTITVAASAADNERVKTNRYLVADSPATWTKESWAKQVQIQLWAPGGSGAGGARTAASIISYGGGGGSGGGYVEVVVPADTLPSTVTVTVGAVGAAGVGSTTNSTNGTAGSSSTDTSFGSNLVAKAGQPGGNTGGRGAAVINNGLSYTTPISSTSGGQGYNGAVGAVSVTTYRTPTGGGGGGGISTTNLQAFAGNGGLQNTNLNNVLGTPVAAAGGSSTGQAGTAGSVYGGVGFGGGGGAPGDTAGTIAGGNGGAGGFPGGGGGGGGGARNGANGGNGGLGGAGLVIITQFG